jgi:hypothetical protein
MPNYFFLMKLKNHIDGMSLELVKVLTEIQKTDGANNDPPPTGQFICSAPAILVALLLGRQKEERKRGRGKEEKSKRKKRKRKEEEELLIDIQQSNKKT